MSDQLILPTLWHSFVAWSSHRVLHKRPCCNVKVEAKFDKLGVTPFTYELRCFTHTEPHKGRLMPGMWPVIADESVFINLSIRTWQHGPGCIAEQINMQVLTPVSKSLRCLIRTYTGMSVGWGQACDHC